MVNKQKSWVHFKHLVHRIHTQKILLILTLLCILGDVVGSLAISILMRHSVDAVVGGDASSFLPLAIRFLAVLPLVGLMVFGERFFAGRFAEKAVAKLRMELVEKLNAAPVSYLDEQHTGDLTSRLTNDINLVRDFLFASIVHLVFFPIMGVVAFIYMLTISWQLTLLVVAAAPILGVLVSIVAKPIQATSRDLQATLGEMNSLVQDSFAGNEVIKAFNLQPVQDKRFGKKLSVSIRKALHLARQRSFMEAVSFFAQISPFFVCFGYGGYLAASGVISIGAFLAFINLLNNISNPIASLPHLIGRYHAAMAAYGRIEEVLELPAERTDGGRFAPTNDTVLQFEHVQFGYGDDLLFDDLSFSIKRGETVALVGASGSGKSTIIKLITGFYTPSKGKLLIYGHDLNTWNLAAMRSYMGIVTQDTYLYPGTIPENISYGASIPPTKEETCQAARLANAHDFIEGELVQGYATAVGERGSNLSGGQKQRIAIARAILKNPDILLLDEPTSALDTESEHLVQQALEELMAQQRTTVIVAHRLSTIKNADRILVIGQGGVIEEGTHTELLAQQGAYYQLYERAV